jgi:hypothetical protein
MTGEQTPDVLVQVVQVDGREIGWGSTLAEQLDDRVADVRRAVVVGARTIADSLQGLPTTEGWLLGDVTAKFGVTLSAQAGVILSTASAGATFEVTVRYRPVAETARA